MDATCSAILTNMSRLIKRKVARTAKLKRYFTGRPCIHGHIAFRQVSNGCCSECHKLLQRKRKKQNVAAVTRYHKQNPEKRRALWWRRRGSSPPTRLRPVRCECCGKKPKRTLHFDHCHKKKEFRGWLCHGCNIGLGMFKDSPKLLMRAIQYLKKYSKKSSEGI